jgi:hypothetical protein
MKKPLNITSRGQSLVVVALIFFAILAMLALILDGGYALRTRRAAQTAADAGALAGARQLCETGNMDLALATALEYAIDRNGAEVANVNIDAGIVTVDTEITFSTFFGRVLGTTEMTAAAIAAAGCFAPGAGETILPIAYSCEDGVLVRDGGDKYCEAIEYDRKFIFMNSRKVDDDLKCDSEPGGTIDCDLDDDGIDELLIGGNRSWLDLSGSDSDAGDGSRELCSWIENGYPRTVQIHTWFAGQPGVSNNVFQCVWSIIGENVYLPVYDAISYGPPPADYHPGLDTIVWSNGASTTYFHVISFAIFEPTCIHATGADRGCELYNGFFAAGVLGPQDKTIEGYFRKGYAKDLKGKPTDGLDVGAYTLYLIR